MSEKMVLLEEKVQEQADQMEKKLSEIKEELS